MILEVFPDLTAPGKGLLFGGWFTYGSPGYQTSEPTWFTLQGNVFEENSSEVIPIYQPQSNGYFNALPVVATSPAGSATIAFSDCSHGTLTYRFFSTTPYPAYPSGIGTAGTGTIPLTRLTANTSCTPGGGFSVAASSQRFSGSWYDPNTSGQGLIFDFSPTQSALFAGWYTFATPSIGKTGAQRWYTLQAANFAANATALSGIPIYASSAGLFDAPGVSTVKVGTADIVFKSCSSMTYTYTFSGGENQGSAGSISLIRLGPAPSECEF